MADWYAQHADVLKSSNLTEAKPPISKFYSMHIASEIGYCFVRRAESRKSAIRIKWAKYSSMSAEPIALNNTDHGNLLLRLPPDPRKLL